MANGEMKGITVRVDADLHAQVREYIESHGMTMGEFVALALDDELHPKNQMKEGKNMGNMRTIAFQVPEDLFQQIKEYLTRYNMTQRQFLMGLIETELERDLEEREAEEGSLREDQEVTEDEEEDEDMGENEPDTQENEEDEAQGMSMGM